LPRYVQLEVRGHQAKAALRWDVPNQTNPRCGWRSGGFYGPSKWRGEKAGATNSNAPTPASVPGKKKPRPGDGRGLCVQERRRPSLELHLLSSCPPQDVAHLHCGPFARRGQFSLRAQIAPRRLHAPDIGREAIGGLAIGLQSPLARFQARALRIPKLIWAHQTSSLAPNGPIQHVLRRGRNRLAGALSRGIRMKSVRTFSGAGPCITLGLILREMDHCVSYRDRQGVRKFISKDCAVHTEPCPACPDHPRTKYPEGYWD
jgi:hypothetical protein